MNVTLSGSSTRASSTFQFFPDSSESRLKRSVIAGIYALAIYFLVTSIASTSIAALNYLVVPLAAASLFVFALALLLTNIGKKTFSPPPPPSVSPPRPAKPAAPKSSSRPESPRPPASPLAKKPAAAISKGATSDGPSRTVVNYISAAHSYTSPLSLEEDESLARALQASLNEDPSNRQPASSVSSASAFTSHVSAAAPHSAASAARPSTTYSASNKTLSKKVIPFLSPQTHLANLALNLVSPLKVAPTPFVYRRGTVEVNFCEYLSCLNQTKLGVLENKEKIIETFKTENHLSTFPNERLESALSEWLYQLPRIPSAINFQGYLAFLYSDHAKDEPRSENAKKELPAFLNQVYSYETHLSAYLAAQNDALIVDENLFIEKIKSEFKNYLNEAFIIDGSLKITNDLLSLSSLFDDYSRTNQLPESVGFSLRSSFIEFLKTAAKQNTVEEFDYIQKICKTLNLLNDASHILETSFNEIINRESDLAKLIELINLARPLNLEVFNFLKTDEINKLIESASLMNGIFEVLENAPLETEDQINQLIPILNSIGDLLNSLNGDELFAQRLLRSIARRFDDLSELTSNTILPNLLLTRFKISYDKVARLLRHPEFVIENNTDHDANVAANFQTLVDQGLL